MTKASHCQHHQGSEWAPQQWHQPPYGQNDAHTNPSVNDIV
jgi:hypothetical protein